MSSLTDAPAPIPGPQAGCDPHPASAPPAPPAYPQVCEAPTGLARDGATVGLRRRHDGWTAARQRIFLDTLAETGRVSEAARTADITPRSAYRLRNHPQGAAFARGWDAAMLRASGRLFSVAMERAIVGTPEVVWRDGRIVSETVRSSDRMLMFLLRHLNPALFDSQYTAAERACQLAARAERFAPAMAALADTDVPAEPLDVDDDRPVPPPPRCP